MEEQLIEDTSSCSYIHVRLRTVFIKSFNLLVETVREVKEKSTVGLRVNVSAI